MKNNTFKIKNIILIKFLIKNILKINRIMNVVKTIYLTTPNPFFILLDHFTPGWGF
jgi:hypothetical protein